MKRSLLLGALAFVLMGSPPANAVAQSRLWLQIVTPTPAFNMDDEVVWTAQPGEWYLVLREEAGWAFAVWEFDSHDNAVWLRLDGRVSRWREPTASPPPAPTPKPPPPARAEECLRAEGSKFGQNIPRGGQQVIEGAVVNRCTQAVAGVIKLSRFSMSESGPNVPGFDKFSEIWLGTLGPGEARPFQIPAGRDLAAVPYWWGFVFRTLPLGSKGHGLPCWRVINSQECLHADARLEGALFELEKVEVGQRLLKWNADIEVVVRTEHLPPGVVGLYRLNNRTVYIDDRTMAPGYGSRERAAVLAHELQHGIDHAEGKLAPRGPNCFANEEDAFRREGEVWAALWNNRLPYPQNFLQAQLNDITILAWRDPYLLLAKYVASYGHDCG